MQPNKIIFILLFILGCGGSGSNTNPTNLPIDVAFIFAHPDKNKLELGEQSFYRAIKFFEELTNKSFNILGVFVVEPFTNAEEHSVYEDPKGQFYKKRTDIVFREAKKLGIGGINVILSAPYPDLDSTGTAGSICSNMNVSYTSVSNFFSTWVLLAHELGHSLGMIHKSCEGCIMNTRNKFRVVDKIHPDNIRFLERCRKLDIKKSSERITCSHVL